MDEYTNGETVSFPYRNIPEHHSNTYHRQDLSMYKQDIGTVSEYLHQIVFIKATINLQYRILVAITLAK